VGVFDYEASDEEYRRRMAERQQRRSGEHGSVFDQEDTPAPRPAQAREARAPERVPEPAPPAPEHVREPVRPAPVAPEASRTQPPRRTGAAQRRIEPKRPEPPRPAPPPPPAPAPAPQRQAPAPAAQWPHERVDGEPGTALPLNLDEQAGWSLLNQLAERFGWAIAATGRRQVEQVLGRPLGDREWQRLRASRWWADGVPAAMREGAAELLPTMLDALGLGDDEREDG
jgi:hypothetical protein